MKRQKNIAQMKEQVQNSDKQRGNNQTTWKEFRVMVIKMIQNLGNRMEKMQESVNTFSKDLEKIKNKQTQIKQLLKLKIGRDQ